MDSPESDQSDISAMPSSARKRFRFGPLHLFLLVPWIGVVVAARGPLRDNSFLWHVRAGELQLDAGRVLTTDPFSFTRLGEPWRTQSWLADLMYRRLELWMGLDFVPWLIASVGAATLVLVTVSAWKKTGSLAAPAVATILTGWLGVGFLSPRPVLFSYVLTAALMLALSSRHARWSIPLLMWVWAALHGSFVVGLGLILLSGLATRRPWRRDLSISIVLVSLTAHGIGVWITFATFFANRQALELISEWGPPRLTNLNLMPYAFFLVVLFIGASNGRVSRRELWVVVPMALFGLTATRAVFPAAVVLSPYVAAVVAGWTQRLDERSSSTALPLNLAATLLIVALPFAIRPQWEGLRSDVFPIDVSKALDDSPVFHDDVVGGYLIYSERPSRLVMVDDRAELYGLEGFTEVLHARGGGPDWRDTFERWQIGQALLEVDDGLATVLIAEGWINKDADENFILLQRP